MWISTLILAYSVVSVPIADVFSKIIQDQYIVVFKNDIQTADVGDHWQWLDNLLAPLLPKGNLFSKTNGLEQSKSALWGILHKFDLPEFKGYSARLPSFIAKLLEYNNLVLLVEPDIVMKIASVQDESPSWGINVIFIN